MNHLVLVFLCCVCSMRCDENRHSSVTSFMLAQSSAEEEFYIVPAVGIGFQLQSLKKAEILKGEFEFLGWKDSEGFLN